MGVVRGGAFICSQEILEITQIFVANSFVPETILGGKNITVNSTGKKYYPNCNYIYVERADKKSLNHICDLSLNMKMSFCPNLLVTVSFWEDGPGLS